MQNSPRPEVDEALLCETVQRLEALAADRDRLTRRIREVYVEAKASGAVAEAKAARRQISARKKAQAQAARDRREATRAERRQEREDARRRRAATVARQTRARDAVVRSFTTRAALRALGPTADKTRGDREQAGFKMRRRIQLAEAKNERRDFDPDFAIPEQCNRHAFTLPSRGALPRRRMRAGVVHDPRARYPDAHVAAAEWLEKMAAEAGRLGAMQNCLANIATVRGSGSGDVDKARARIVRADRELKAVMAAISDAPALDTPAGPRSQRAAIQLCVLEGLPITALAGTQSSRPYERARGLLREALDRLAEIHCCDLGATSQDAYR